MKIGTYKSPNPRNRNSISLIKSKFLSVSLMNKRRTFGRAKYNQESPDTDQSAENVWHRPSTFTQVHCLKKSLAGRQNFIRLKYILNKSEIPFYFTVCQFSVVSHNAPRSWLRTLIIKIRGLVGVVLPKENSIWFRTGMPFQTLQMDSKYRTTWFV